MMRLLIQNGANINAANQNNQTALITALERGTKMNNLFITETH